MWKAFVFLSAEDDSADCNILDEQSRKQRCALLAHLKTWDTEDRPDSYKNKKKKQQKSAIAFKYQRARKRLDKVPARKMLWTVKKEIIFRCLFHTVFRTTEFSFFETISITWKKYDSIISLFPSWEEPISLSKIDCLGQKYEVILSSDIDSIGS